MATWSKTQRVCATCRYWIGRRDIEHTESFFGQLLAAVSVPIHEVDFGEWT